MVTIIRGLINDLGPVYTYGNDRIEELIVISAYMVIREVDFGYAYTIDVDTISITDDPTDNNDLDFVALVCLKTACLIQNGEYITDSVKAVSVKDGPSIIDVRGRVDHKKEIANKACDDYERAKISYLAGDYSVGRGIVGPYASGSSSSSSIFG